MKRFLLPLLVLTLLAAACGDDNNSAASLTEAEREWCTIPDGSEASALRFDIIFEAGISLELNMDLVNAQAAGRYNELLADGLDADEAARKAAEGLFDDEAFVAACREAYRIEGG